MVPFTMNNKKPGLCRPFFLIAGLATLVGVLIFSQADSGITPNDNRDFDGTDGITSAPFGCDATNGYPFIRFAGPGSEHESEIFLFHSPPSHKACFFLMLTYQKLPAGDLLAATIIAKMFSKACVIATCSVPAAKPCAPDSLSMTKVQGET